MSPRRALISLLVSLLVLSGSLGRGNAQPPSSEASSLGPVPNRTTTIPTTTHPTTTATATTTATTATTTATTHTTPATTAQTTTATAQTTTATAQTTTATAHTTTATTHTTTRATTVLPTNGTTTVLPTNGTTPNATTAGPTAPPTPAPQVHSFRVNNTKGNVCMLLDFNAVVRVKYEVYDNRTTGSMVPDVAVVNITDTLSYEGQCEDGRWRNFTLFFPDADAPCVQLVLTFAANADRKTYRNWQTVLVNYTEPCFPALAVNYTQTEKVGFDITYNGTVGKSYKCKSKECRSKEGRFTVLMNSLLFQPFAQNSSKKGDFGDVESCEAPVTVPTTPTPLPTKPSPSHGGRIAGIVIAVLVAVVVVVALSVWVVRRRRYKAVTYGNLENETQ